MSNSWMCLEVFDASTKFPSGILSGNTFDFGNYDECIGINVQLDDDIIKGQYCLPKITIEIPDISRIKSTGTEDNFISTWSKIQVILIYNGCSIHYGYIYFYLHGIRSISLGRKKSLGMNSDGRFVFRHRAQKRI